MAPIEYPPLKPGNFLRALEAKVPQKFVRDILNRLRFRDQAPLSDAALFVPLQDVHAAYAPDPDKGAPEFRRRHSGLVRGGEDKASVSATFDFNTLPRGLARLLDDADIELEDGEPLIVRRQLKPDGKSRAFVNDQPVSVGLLRDMAGFLVELHGQHDDRGLVNPRGHRALLDRFAGADTARVAEAWSKWRSADSALVGLILGISRPNFATNVRSCRSFSGSGRSWMR